MKLRPALILAFLALCQLAAPVRPLAPPARADAALYVDEAKGDQWGWAVDYPSIGHAMQRARRECGENCRFVLAFRSGCGAWAADQAQGSTAWGWGRAETREQAESLAHEQCRKFGGSAAQCLTRVWGCNSLERSSRAKIGRADRLVFVRLRLDLEERESDGTPPFLHRRVRFCGYTHMSYAEEMAYSEAMAEITSSREVTGRAIVAPHFMSGGIGRGQTHDEGRMAMSPVMLRFRERVRLSPYYELRTSDTPFDVADDNGRYDGVIIAFRDLGDYPTLFDIHCASEVRDWPSVHKDAVDLGRF